MSGQLIGQALFPSERGEGNEVYRRQGRDCGFFFDSATCLFCTAMYKKQENLFTLFMQTRKLYATRN